VNVRIIAATNKNMEEEMKKNNFRSDLFYRLAAFQIHLPSLKERKADIGLLAKHFADVFIVKTKKGHVSINEDCIRALEQYLWPGNIRELKNVIERAVILTDSNSLTVESLPFEIQSSSNVNSDHSLSAFSLASIEKLHIQKVLNYTKGNKTETAKLLNIGLTTLYRKIEEYKIQ
jgi:DNA-binding NtrC family response regulator